MSSEYISPQHAVKAFNCPHCGAFAHQRWQMAVNSSTSTGGGTIMRLKYITASFCDMCNRFALWEGSQLFYPAVRTAPLPLADMPEEVKADYNEARDIFSNSPRGAAALLRLAIQKLVAELGETGDNLNVSIGNLVKKGLPERIQKALDVVRVVGNNAVHPGQIVIEDNPDIALNLFKLLNLIVERTHDNAA